MKKFALYILMLLMASVAGAQQTINTHKVSDGVVRICQSPSRSSINTSTVQKERRFMALLTFTNANQSPTILESYGCRIVDRIGRIHIVEIPVNQVGNLSQNPLIERIEAESMPMPAMDVTPGQIDATNVYKGINLPQAFTGRGVAAGVFDNGFDFTHPAFLDANGRSRARYYYDFCWENEDGTLGHALNTTEEIEEYGGTHYSNASLHGTHVMGIMAGRAVNGKYQGMAPDAEIYAAHFNSLPSDFNNPDEQTSANCVLGFKYIFDRAQADGKPCVINFSSGEPETLGNQRILESEALNALTGPGRIITVCAGNSGFYTSYIEKPDSVLQAGMGIINGIGGGQTIDLDIVTPGNQNVRIDFLSLRLLGATIEKTLTFTTDSVLQLQGDTCRLNTTVTLGDIFLKIWKTDIEDERGDVIHLHGDMPNLAYLMLCGALCLFTSNNPAWVYGNLKYCPFVNIDGVPAYSYANLGHSLWWPGTLPGLITVGATGYKSSFRNIDGNLNTDMDEYAADQPGLITKFSSLGPNFQEEMKPDVVAPGMSINAPFNSFVSITDNIRKELVDQITYNGKTYYYTAQSGTSMSTPVVAGAIALWLEADPTLTCERIIDVIAHTSTHPDASMTYPNNVYGYGQIDVYQGLLYILGLMDNLPNLSHTQPVGAQFNVDGKRLTVNMDEWTEATATIYDTAGKQLISTTLDADHASIDLSTLNTGDVYAVQLDTGSPLTTGSTLIRP